ncbi:MAG: PocR ligand-binding domain-containing protein [candidate division Zixibacteria bacterium]|nr:PocR ligand-binding domain-containing protein [candidate division Zixibacteria bacterium]
MPSDSKKTKKVLIQEVQQLRQRISELEGETTASDSSVRSTITASEKSQGFPRFESLFNINELQEIQDSFAIATGVASIIAEPNGTPITRPSNFCRLCKDIIRGTEIGRKNCYWSSSESSKFNPAGPFIRRCLSGGFWDAVASIAVGEHHIANWLIGQVRDEDINEKSFLDYADKIGADRKEFEKALDEVTVMSAEKFSNVAQALFLIANQMSKTAYKNSFLKRTIAEKQQTENQLQESEKRLSELIRNSRLSIEIYNDQGVLVQANKAWGKLWNIPIIKEIVGNYNILDDPQANELGFSDLVKRAFKGESFDVPEFAYDPHKSGYPGRKRHLHSYIYPIVAHNKSITNVIVTHEDITDRVKFQSERERLIAELEAKNTELERFTYTVSHDLKSPLITIRGFVGLIKKDFESSDHSRVRDDIERITIAADRMYLLLEDVLHLSRIGRVVNIKENVSLRELALEAQDMLAGQISEKGIEITVPSEMPVIFGDRTRLYEVFQNLLENAVKFSGDAKKPHIEFGVYKQDSESICYIKDNGLGIDPKYHSKVFDLFDQLNQEADGTGVGLTLVRRIIETHGGRIWVESEGKGKGTKVCFIIQEKGKAK